MEDIWPLRKYETATTNKIHINLAIFFYSVSSSTATISLSIMLHLSDSYILCIYIARDLSFSLAFSLSHSLPSISSSPSSAYLKIPLSAWHEQETHNCNELLKGSELKKGGKTFKETLSRSHKPFTLFHCEWFFVVVLYFNSLGIFTENSWEFVIWIYFSKTWHGTMRLSVHTILCDTTSCHSLGAAFGESGLCKTTNVDVVRQKQQQNQRPN